ncbi:hypothetical protein F441_11990 [Phytophthora nicotianae CJ01A1]|uniref:Uncharacterized protein n=5 Tax=Phytophthora nicotianae TaxID=4792 RepID=W2Q1C2_PHYN3|nr:hypothetical protein PPTG_23356 [Phytophthora nicotianae INRA-310]ETI42931.1 hypothetical protein F443_12024 [Phytophthora nicotianae P1569]ETK82940.1 hypothetical protein L915_11738 [Phytophthora nicotianae]ETO71565.1 hypothetical protein F444_12119 [Phytophthora nicotianae P1976]ETP12627.1 hypothetical protein F441_11990 [Phytophthora nicotianae CJ01A1]ETL36347.1 hypothetical protein L916_11663 [Phytophthora nicotianae]
MSLAESQNNIEENDVTPYTELDKRALFTFHPRGQQQQQSQT